MCRLKLFGMIVMISLVILNSTACTKESQNEEELQAAKNESNHIELAANEQIKSKVLLIDSVIITKQGMASDFIWTDEGKQYSFLEVTKGKVVLLNFWATWCPPCRMEIPDIIQLDKELPDQDFVVIGIALDNRGTLEQVKALVSNFSTNNKMEYLQFIPTKDIITPYGGISSIPATFIIDRKGNIVERIVGARSKTEFLTSIKRAMNS